VSGGGRRHDDELYGKGTEAFASWNTCAVVGNSGHLLRSKYGEDIDAHDVVMRMNQAPTKG
jgi:hypothetical protein